MESVQAWELLHDPDHNGRLNTAQFYDLMVRAGYSEREANEAALRRGWDRLAAGELM